MGFPIGVGVEKLKREGLECRVSQTEDHMRAS